MSVGLSEDLQRCLFEALEHATPGDHWVMSPEWLAEVRKLADATGRPLWVPSFSLSAPEHLLGYMIEVRKDGGVPHLEPS